MLFKNEKALKEYLFQKTKYTCEKCGGNSYLETHHIIRRSEAPELILESENVMLLCKSCHIKEHIEKRIYTTGTSEKRCKLIELRLKSGLTQIEVANKINWSQEQYSLLESGKRKIDVMKGYELSKVFNIGIDDFVDYI